jgi:hypothetical protein
MSRRPMGPCDRNYPFYLDSDGLEDQRDAPRLPGQTIVSKLMVGALLLCCCGIIAISVLCVASLWASMPQIQQIQQQQPHQAASGAVVSIDQRVLHEGRPRHHTQRSVIRRLAMLRRAPQDKRVDLESVKLMFPQWLNSDGVLVADLAVNDVILALSYLAQEDEAAEGVAVAQPQYA